MANSIPRQNRPLRFREIKPKMEPIDLKRVRTVPLQARKNKVAWEQFARPPQPGCSFAEFLASLPHILAGQDFREVVRAVVTARQNQRPVVVGPGAHVIKCVLSPWIIASKH